LINNRAMNLQVLRYSGDTNSTLGVLLIDGAFECYTLEDEKREVKVKGETRIPEGIYKVSLRSEGGTSARYSKKFPSFHEGMLCVHNAPDWKVVTDKMSFQYILIHIGNNEDHTAGCLLVGNTANNNRHKAGLIGESTDAYKRMYKKVVAAIERGEEITIEYKDLENK